MRTTAIAVTILTASAGLVATGAAALDRSDARAVQIRALLDPLPEELDGLLVELRQTPHPQLSVHNLTGDTLTILDHAERPYLRIGPQDTYADFANAWFHRARHASDAPLPANTGGPARWHKIDSGPAYAWWDPRLRVARDLPLPNGVADTVFLRRWRIPVRLGEVRSNISGYFLFDPARGGVHRAEIGNPGTLGGRVAVHPLLGRTPGIFIANYGNARFTVRGIKNEPLLRFIPGKVMVNPHSVTWKQAVTEDSPVPYAGPGEPSWVVVSTTSGFGWHDPRVRADGRRPEDRRPAPVAEWSIPVSMDGNDEAIEGRTWWLPPATGR